MSKKIVAVLLASAMSVSLLAGCGSDDQTSGSGAGAGGGSGATSGGGSTQQNSEPSGGNEEVDRYAWEQTWPDGQVITWLVLDQSASADYSRYFDLVAIKKIEEMFHVDIQFETIISKQENKENYNLRLQDSPLPDVLGINNDEYFPTGIAGLYNEGFIIELNDLIDSRMPHLQDIFANYPNAAKDMSNADGKFLYLQRINPLEKPADYWAATTTGLVMRQTWLDEVNEKVPTTMEDWYRVLTAFKEKDPNGNGKNDEIPFHTSGSGLMLFEAAYGIVATNVFIDPTGKVEHGARTQNYKAYLEEMNKWYKEGLMYIDPENPNNLAPGSAVYEDLVAANTVGSWKGSSNNNTKKYMDTLREANPDEAIVAVPWPTSSYANNVVYSERSVDTKQRTNVCVTTDAAKDQAKLDAIATIFDYMLSEEGSLLLTWGEEGVTFTTNADGTKSLTEYGNEQITLPDESKPQQYKMYGNVSAGFPSFGNFDVDLATRDEWYNESAKVWADADFSLNYPGTISLTPEQNARLQEWTGDSSQLGSYITEMKIKFITGEEPLSNFDTYLANLETMGIQNIVDIYQEAYDAYMAK